MVDGVLAGGSENSGSVVRVGDTVRRPRRGGFEVVEALLIHLGNVGFDRSPRFLGVDDQGRQVLEFLPGEAPQAPRWLQDDETNAGKLGRVASTLRDLHEATSSFIPLDGSAPRRPLANPGAVWTHGDVGYGNIVYSDADLVGLIDWEFAAPADRCNDLAALLAMSVRSPRPGADDHPRRARAVELARNAIAGGYGLSEHERDGLAAMAARCIDHAVEFWKVNGYDQPIDDWEWRAQWFRGPGNPETLTLVQDDDPRSAESEPQK